MAIFDIAAHMCSYVWKRNVKSRRDRATRALTVSNRLIDVRLSDLCSYFPRSVLE